LLKVALNTITPFIVPYSERGRGQLQITI
jgi:hypothetical protein